MGSKPHIVIFAPFFPPYRGAVASRLYSLAEYWGDLCQVTVISNYRGKLPQTYRMISFPLTRYSSESIYIPFLFSRLIKLLKQIKPDVIFVSIPTTWPLLEGYYASRRLGIHLIVDVRDLPTSTYERRTGNLGKKCIYAFMRALCRYLIPKASRLVTVTEWFRKELMELYQYPQNRIHLIRNGSEVSLFKKARSVKKTFDIVYSGTIISVRNPAGIVSFLRALAELYPSLKALFISPLDTDISRGFYKEVENSRLRDHVFFEHPRPVEELPELLGKARLGLNALSTSNPAYRGAIGAKEYEYLAAGLPIMGLLDPDFFVEEGGLIKDYRVGFADPDPGGLARKAAELLRTPSNLKKMSSRAIKTGELFDRGRLAIKYLNEVIMPVLKTSRHPRSRP